GVFIVAGEAAIKGIVPDRAMGRAQAANQARDAALGLAGGPLGGALLGVGAWLVAAAMAVCQFIALVTAMILRRGDTSKPEAAPVVEGPSSGWCEAKVGIGWLLRRPDLRGVLFVATIINLGFNAGMTTVIYSLQLEGHSPQEIGVLAAAISAVMLVGAIAAPMVVARVKAGTLILAGLVLAAVGMLALSLVQSIAGIVAVLAAGLLLIPGLNAGLLGYQVVATPSRLLGRVNSALGVTVMAAMPLAPIIAGFGLEWVGRTGTLLVAGTICLVAAGLAIATPSIRALPNESEWAAHASKFAEEA
ncbi:MAG: MFS transporter, partial [Ruaniaceae bacterium]|nr:MFS transporter [Ruaniaceae bacterium]